jgi:hypothetical protein
VQGAVLPCKIDIRAWWNWYQHTMEAIDGDHGGGVLDEGEVVVVGLGGVDGEIKSGG